jgi:hypothetical protein
MVSHSYRSQSETRVPNLNMMYQIFWGTRALTREILGGPSWQSTDGSSSRWRVRTRCHFEGIVASAL